MNENNAVNANEELETDFKDECFIVTPIGNENSDERRFADGIVDAVISPILQEEKMKPVVSHRIYESGTISKQVIEKLYTSKLVIANLTGLNPNVMYEVGIRLTMRKHIILICEEGTNLPFDITAERTIFYKNDIMGSVELSNKLRSMIKSIDFNKHPANPIYDALSIENAMSNIDQITPDDAFISRLKELIDYGAKRNIAKPAKQTKFAILEFSEKTKVSNLLSDGMNSFVQKIIEQSNFLIAPNSLTVTGSDRLIIFKFTTDKELRESEKMLENMVRAYFGEELKYVTVMDNN